MFNKVYTILYIKFCFRTSVLGYAECMLMLSALFLYGPLPQE